MLTGYYVVGTFCLLALGFVLWYDHWYTPRHKKK